MQVTESSTSISDATLAKGKRKVDVFGPSHNTRTRVTVSKDL